MIPVKRVPKAEPAVSRPKKLLLSLGQRFCRG